MYCNVLYNVPLFIVRPLTRPVSWAAKTSGILGNNVTQYKRVRHVWWVIFTQQFDLICCHIDRGSHILRVIWVILSSTKLKRRVHSFPYPIDLFRWRWKYCVYLTLYIWILSIICDGHRCLTILELEYLVLRWNTRQDVGVAGLDLPARLQPRHKSSITRSDWLTFQGNSEFIKLAF